MRDLPAPLTSLVDAALGGEDPENLLRLAHRELGRPLGLVAPSGRALGYAPADDRGSRALAVAGAGARTRLVAPPGWSIVLIEHGSLELGVLAFGGAPGPLLDLLVKLLAEQLQRRELLRGRTAEFLRRLVSAGAGEPDLRREAAELGLELAEAYWLGLLAWRDALPPASVLDAIEGEAGDGGLTVRLGARIVLLQPATTEPRPSWFERIVGRARTHAPWSGAQVVATDTPVDLAHIGARAADLGALVRLAPRAEGDAPVISARRYALDRLLAQAVGRSQSHAFVAEQLGPLIAWDREHHGNLLVVLEAALDFPRHDHAAARCFMHRNTFRHRLRQATEILHDDLEDPDRRLALHVALKLHRTLAARSRQPAAARQ